MGAVAAEFVEPGKQFDVGALACGRADSRPKIGYGLDGIEVFPHAMPSVDGRNYLVDETIKTHQGFVPG